MMKNTIALFFSNSTKHRISEALIESALSVAAEHCGPQKNMTVDVAVVSERAMQKLNKFWRGKNRVTDVLSFSYLERKKGAHEFVNPPDNVVRLGQIILCPSYINKQARRAKVSQETEFKRALVHGFLHLLGYDHEKSAKEEEKMLELQESILKEVT